ncbi:hypothetical protein LA76x_1801 [Lysobacter antibioticus]|uniref:Uncharacterized protein n=1 Tax=Lysobacter antibioticus TaxID=84531 RepID=A0A0S2F8U1_LYSAN|nr:hypothetical protein LA76x_1801 [Lysobacter antibioticus]
MRGGRFVWGIRAGLSLCWAVRGSWKDACGVLASGCCGGGYTSAVGHSSMASP